MYIERYADGAPALEDAAREDPALEDAAFGASPGESRLPPAVTPLDSWRRAVALGARGYYGRSAAELTRTHALGRTDPLLRSLALSTEGSLRRQLGWHRLAGEFDGAAFALVGALESSEPLAIAARCDALTGLAADALGQGRLALGEQLLGRCATELERSDERVWRQRLRLMWVSAEISFASGAGTRALELARAGDELARECPSVRHRIKTRLLLAAAFCVQGDLDGSRDVALDVLQQCEDQGLLPLRWAAAMLLAGVDPSAGGADIARECELEIQRRGGRFRKT